MTNALQPPPARSDAQLVMQNFHASVVDEVRQAVEARGVVVVGMLWNPHVGRARRALDRAGVPYRYLGYGSYLTGWKQRLAIKLWSGWPTYPQVFVDGELLGGANETLRALDDGSLRPDPAQVDAELQAGS